jgi:hypothetical protein
VVNFWGFVFYFDILCAVGGCGICKLLRVQLAVGAVVSFRRARRASLFLVSTCVCAIQCSAGGPRAQAPVKHRSNTTLSFP